MVADIISFCSVVGIDQLCAMLINLVDVSQIALEELADRVNGDMRMALNQLHYMSLSMSVIKYEDVRQRLLSSGKDEDISPFTAVDKYDFISVFVLRFSYATQFIKI